MLLLLHATGGRSGNRGIMIALSSANENTYWSSGWDLSIGVSPINRVGGLKRHRGGDEPTLPLLKALTFLINYR